MKTRDINHHKPVLTALRKAGFNVVETEKHGTKIVITVTRYKQPEKRDFNYGMKFLNGGG